MNGQQDFRRRLSVQTKVLIPVVTFLILLPTITLWVASQHIANQVETDARETLSTAEAVFLKSMESRAQDLLVRYQFAADQPKFRTGAFRTDSATMNEFLGAMLKQSGPENEAAIFINGRGEAFAGMRQNTSLPLLELERAAVPITERALAGEASFGGVGILGNLYYALSIPVRPSDSEPVAGALTIAVRIRDAVVNELKALTQAEIVLVIDGKSAASTLSRRDVNESVIAQMSGSSDLAHKIPISLNGEHYMALRGVYGNRGAPSALQYILLSSYEPGLRALAETNRKLVTVSLLGILVSSLVVWFFVRRFTHPILELRDSAEAVGRGDFSHKITRFSNDECGDLANAFNRMTSGLESSRAQLEKTVETLKATQAQLVQSEKLSAVGQFVAGVAHELNNPLTAVIGFSDLLSQTSSDPKIRPQLELIAKSAHRCHKIVHSLLSFARQHAPERKFVMLDDTIDEVIEIMAYDLRTSNIEVVKDYEPDLPGVTGDPHQLQQVFINILSNARQAIQSFQREGRIILRTRKLTDFIRIEFEDNGPGISAENITKIFDPFFTTKAVGKGTGLGLSLTYGIIQEHGGKITAQSQLGNGATFQIDLPISSGPAALFKSDHPATHSAASPDVTGKKVLVVDDEEWILKLVEELLSKDGFIVQTVNSGDKALEAARAHRFDLIISDWKMPGLSGIQLYEHLVAKEPAAGERIFFMTGDVISDSFQEFLRKHSKICLSKPFSIDEFRAAAARLASQK